MDPTKLCCHSSFAMPAFNEPLLLWLVLFLSALQVVGLGRDLANPDDPADDHDPGGARGLARCHQNEGAGVQDEEFVANLPDNPLVFGSGVEPNEEAHGGGLGDAEVHGSVVSADGIGLDAEAQIPLLFGGAESEARADDFVVEDVSNSPDGPLIFGDENSDADVLW
eukprot:TRINITY_DN6856_c0_g1_i1.p1 TRINITY_DN6856_c0_g1~~TRINITY_DN6856_c0_g1_i1.p1  ORF type:complete len:167 (-),score=45.33 TRINITY_DN6856_c0_g1_i1:150-650(-)